MLQKNKHNRAIISQKNYPIRSDRFSMFSRYGLIYGQQSIAGQFSKAVSVSWNMPVTCLIKANRFKYDKCTDRPSNR